MSKIKQSDNNYSIIVKARTFFKNYFSVSTDASFAEWKDREEKKLKSLAEEQLIEEKEIIMGLYKKDSSLVKEYINCFNSTTTKKYIAFYSKFKEYYKDSTFLAFTDEERGYFISHIFNKTFRKHNKDIKHFIIDSFKIPFPEEGLPNIEDEVCGNSLNSIERLKITSPYDNTHVQKLLFDYYQNTLEQIENYFCYKLTFISKSAVNKNSNNEHVIKQDLKLLQYEIQKVFRKVLASFHPDNYSESKGFNKELGFVVGEKYKELENNKDNKLKKIENYIANPMLLVIDQQNENSLNYLSYDQFSFQRTINNLFVSFVVELKRANIIIEQNHDELLGLKKETLKDISDTEQLQLRIGHFEKMLTRVEKRLQNKPIKQTASKDTNLSF
jgi:hypothetical protein